MIFTHCPLCKSELGFNDNGLSLSRWCNSCLNDDMPRFRAEYSPDNKLTFVLWWLGDHYIEIDYIREKTTITYIEVCIRRDPVVLNLVLNIDPEDPDKTRRRLDYLIYFA